MVKYKRIKKELVNMAKQDEKVSNKLLKEGTLFEGYNKEMEDVHNRNAQRIEEMIDEIGWPTKSKVGEEASNTAWLIVQHAISQPHLQRKVAAMLQTEVVKGEMHPANLAFLQDRICFFERRPQKYGTQFDWDENGELSAWEIDDPQIIDELRLKMGLLTMKEQTKQKRKTAKKEGETPPDSYKNRVKKMKEWAKKVGWIE